MTRWWPAPAKLNLFLHIVGRRADGYHELQTVFQLIDLCDQLAFEPADDGQITRIEGPADLPAADDLVLRAARALQHTADSRYGALIRLRKRIPMGGGLGGGSSDAATTLFALNIIWKLSLSPQRLAEIGLGLGADVPVFLSGQNAWAEGVGECLTPLELPSRWYLVLHPGVSVATRDVFQAAELTRNSPLRTIRALAPGDPDWRNDCEGVVRHQYPAVGEALDWLGRWAPARLTGTGSCIFSAFERAADAERVAARVPDVWRAWVVRGLERSPLLGGSGAG